MTASARARTAVTVLLPLITVMPLARAQEPAPIQDNSFLIEEAYNQEAGVVQHINTFTRVDGGHWAYSLTQEWPLGGIRHQLSYTLPVLQPKGAGAGIGDIALNYRYQLAGNPDARLLVAPRGTLLVPTGSEEKGRGTGELGFQTNLPVTYAVAPQIAAHGNAGFTAMRHAATNFNLGASAIWLARPSFNVVLEGLWLSDGADESAFLNPGIRWAFNFASGVQVVPGLAYTVGLGPSRGEDGVFLYLSLEHRFRRQ
jgi:Putative MetA-pathway of phenol degradation